MFVLLVTAYNISKNPFVEAEETTTETYVLAGMRFEGPLDMRFNYSKLGEKHLSYMEGYVYRVRYNNETHLPFISITWRECEPINFTEAVSRGYNYSDPDEVIYDFDRLVNSTISDHIFLYTSFNKINSKDNRTGYIGFWNCTNSGRIHTLLVENSMESNNTALFDLFNQSRTSFECHFPGQRPSSEIDEIELPFDVNTLIKVVMIVMMTVGFTFTFMMEGFLNFAHTRYASIGAMISFYLTRYARFNPYDTWPFAAIFGGLIGVFLYIFIVRPIRSRGKEQGITLTLTFLVISFVIPFMLHIFNYWSRYWGDIFTHGYDLSPFDFKYRGLDGIIIMAPVTCLLLIIGLQYFLKKTKTGISLRAASENEDLALIMGINTFRAHCITWFISGSLSALAGSILSIHQGAMIGGTDELIISIMSGAILGGLYNIYGSIFGGIFIALAQDFLKKFFFIFLGLPALKWQGVLPIIFLVLIMTIFPEGITGEKSDLLKKISLKIKQKLGN